MDLEHNEIKPTNYLYKFFAFIGFCMSFYHLYTGGFGLNVAFLQRSVHLAFVIVLGYYYYQSKYKPLDIILGLIGLLSCLYTIFNYASEEFAFRIYYVTPVTLVQIIMCLFLVISILELGRRVLGPGLSILAVVFLIYFFIGPYITGFFHHEGMEFINLVEELYLTTEGIYGIAIAISATFIFLFILFGALLEYFGAGDLFIETSRSILGKYKGGPALMAIFASGFFGMISGVAAANVMATGTFTIPLMKKIGYKKEFAGAVEAVASTGGQIMPPIMGAGAFVMAELLGIPYLKIIVFFITGYLCHT